MRHDWVTNDPKTAKALRAADRAYQAARLLAIPMPLADKIMALRIAKHDHEAACNVVWDSEL